MTCVVGLQWKGEVWLGGDSAGTASDFSQRVRDDKKVFFKEDFVIGFCGSFRVGQLLKHSLEITKRKTSQSVDAYLVNDFMASLKKCVTAEQGEDSKNWAILFGYGGGLYVVHADYQVGKPHFGFDAVGSGADIAIGAMHASEHIKDPRKRLTMALEASAHNNAAVRAPFNIIRLKK